MGNQTGLRAGSGTAIAGIAGEGGQPGKQSEIRSPKSEFSGRVQHHFLAENGACDALQGAFNRW